MTGIHGSVHSEGDPTAVLTEIYDDLTICQKKSIVNLMYMIGSASGLSQDQIRHSIAVSQQILMINIPWEACYQQYTQFGNEKIFQDLCKVSESVMDMVVLQCLFFTTEMRTQSTESNSLDQHFFESFEKLGYSEQKINALVQKTEALHKLMNE